MLVLPILKHMNSQDLAQRYQGSWIKYDGQVIFCIGFNQKEGGRKELIYTHNPVDEMSKATTFDFQLLDTRRPKSRWYIVDNEPIFLSLSVEKQFCRGVNIENCWLFEVDNYFPNKDNILNTFIHEFLDEKNQQVDWKRRSPIKHISEEVSNGELVLLSPYLLICPDGSIYYRTTLVGHLLPNDTIHVFRQFIVDELKTCCLGVELLIGADLDVFNLPKFKKPALEF